MGRGLGLSTLVVFLKLAVLGLATWPRRHVAFSAVNHGG